MVERVLRVDECSQGFTELVTALSGVQVDACFQCGKCASGCPVAFAMDYTPTQLVHLIQLGQREEVLSSRTIWLCSACQTCSTRCPQGVDLAEVMDALRIIAAREHRAAPVPAVPAFLRHSIGNIGVFGRTYELGLMASLKLSTGDIRQDLGLGLRMLGKGKFNLLPGFRGSGTARRIIRRVKAREKT